MHLYKKKKQYSAKKKKKEREKQQSYWGSVEFIFIDFLDLKM